MSPGTGKIKSPIVHSPFVPALPPIVGRPPTSTTLNTSISSCTSPARAREIAEDRVVRASASRGTCEIVGWTVNGVSSLAAERLRRREANVSRKVRSLSLPGGCRQLGKKIDVRIKRMTYSGHYPF